MRPAEMPANPHGVSFSRTKDIVKTIENLVEVKLTTKITEKSAVIFTLVSARFRHSHYPPAARHTVGCFLLQISAAPLSSPGLPVSSSPAPPYHHIPHPHIEARIHTAAAPACPLLSGVGIPAPCPASARLPSGRSRRNGTPHRSVGRRCIAGARSHLGHLGWDGRDMPLSSGPQKSWVSFIPFCQSLHDFEHRAARTSRIEQHIPRTLIFDAFCLYCRLAITRHQQWAVF